MGQRTIATSGAMAFLAATASGGLMLAAFWLWQNAMAITFALDQPLTGAWAVRSAAIAIASAAQTLLVIAVLRPLYSPDPISRFYGKAAATVALMSMGCAAILWLVRF